MTEETVMPPEVLVNALACEKPSVIHYYKRKISADVPQTTVDETLQKVLKIFLSFRWFGSTKFSVAWLTKLMETILIENREFANTRSWDMGRFKNSNFIDFTAYKIAEKLLMKCEQDTIYQVLSYRYPFYCKKDISTLNSPIVCFKEVMMVKIKYINLYSPSESRYEFLYLWKIAQKKNEPLGLLPLTFIQMVCVYLYRYDALSMDLKTYQLLSIM